MSSPLSETAHDAAVSSVTLTPEVVAAALGQFAPTAEQSAVIASPLAPALVVAGAGSGKTETMAGRVVWLVANGIVARSEILGLTFTRKAAGELAERIQRRLARLAELEQRGLLSHLPALYEAGLLQSLARLEREGAPARARYAVLDALADRVHATLAPTDSLSLLDRPTVSTYNSFADGIMREHAMRIGRDPEATVLSESAAWLLMRRVVYGSDDPRLVDLDKPASTVIDAALRIARDAVDNIVDLDELARFPAAFRRVCELPSTRRGTTVYAEVAKASTAVDGLEVLVDLARLYNDHKRRLGVQDFSDQVAGAHRIVHSHPDVAEGIRGRYRVVLLDEYQDTSVVQTQLLARLFADRAVMAVGDPHQAIYGWRGASAGNLGGFAAAFAPASECGRYSLLTSWRNSARVLAAADAVQSPLTAAVPVGALRARPDAPQGHVSVYVEQDVDGEADRVAEWFADVRTQRAREGESTTGAILFRTKKHMDRFAQALAARAIPHRILGLGGLLSTPEVVDVISALQVISDPRAGSALIRLLAGPRWRIGVADLRRLALLARRLWQHDAGLHKLDDEVIAHIRTSSGDDEGSLVDALDFVARSPETHSWLNNFTPEARRRLREAGTVFAGLRRSAALPVVELIRLIVLELRLDVELAANEQRGPARVAASQLREFVDEVRTFLAADEAGTLPSLLAWLDHAGQRDELAPRTEPAEDDVVQLLTIHGSKGLEWDAVAVVRLVEGELPTTAKDTRGWLAFGVLPYEFRPDAAWLPMLAWRSSATQQDIEAARKAFIQAHRDRQIQEERRLAYVAVTRARDRLLLTASPWAGTTRPRQASRFLEEITTALGIPMPVVDVGENPFEGHARLLRWPMDPLGARRAAVQEAAEAVTRARRQKEAIPDEDLVLLLRERQERLTPDTGVAPVRVPASRYKDFVADYAGTVRGLQRPLPERPYRQTRLGTAFHSWVERRSGLVGSKPGLDDELWEQESPGGDLAAADRQALAALQAAFERSEWAPLQPIAVETEIDFRFVGLDGRAHLAICKLDAVYERGDRIEIVDWKTGVPPRDEKSRQERMLQLELYRRAYHERHGVPVDRIDVALYYVAHDLVLRA